jgi:transcriptional regulator of acetoin/glycerol metabolism
MRNEINDMKHVIVDLMNGDSTMSQSDINSVKQKFSHPESKSTNTPGGMMSAPVNQNRDFYYPTTPDTDDFTYHDPIEEHVELEESLSLEEREKELIIKALNKHNGKRKYAAKELGISERTLYRKIKEYDIQK